jgi:hypothetical protein
MGMSLTWNRLDVEVVDNMRFSDRLKYDRGYAWSPNPAPVKEEDLPGYLYDELTKLSQSLYQIYSPITINVPVSEKLPTNPVEGSMVVIPNGTGTNQLKIFLNGTWVLIV